MVREEGVETRREVWRGGQLEGLPSRPAAGKGDRAGQRGCDQGGGDCGPAR
jgi:hypothetical protein